MNTIEHIEGKSNYALALNLLSYTQRMLQGEKIIFANVYKESSDDNLVCIEKIEYYNKEDCRKETIVDSCFIDVDLCKTESNIYFVVDTNSSDSLIVRKLYDNDEKHLNKMYLHQLSNLIKKFPYFQDKTVRYQLLQIKDYWELGVFDRHNKLMKSISLIDDFGRTLRNHPLNYYVEWRKTFSNISDIQVPN